MSLEQFLAQQRHMWQLLATLQRGPVEAEIVWNHVKSRLNDLHTWLSTSIQDQGLCFGINMKELSKCVDELTHTPCDQTLLAKLLLKVKDILQNLTGSLADSFADVKQFLSECREGLANLHASITPHPAHAYHSAFNWTP